MNQPREYFDQARRRLESASYSVGAESKSKIRLENQLSALKSAVLGTNADLLALIKLVPSVPETQAIKTRLETRIKTLKSLETTQEFKGF